MSLRESSVSYMVKWDEKPSLSPQRRRMRAQVEWKVAAQTSSAPSPPTASILSFSSPAALLVKVMASICHGSARPALMIYAMRLTSTVVLPEPAPARISKGPSVQNTA